MKCFSVLRSQKREDFARVVCAACVWAGRSCQIVRKRVEGFFWCFCHFEGTFFGTFLEEATRGEVP